MSAAARFPRVLTPRGRGYPARLVEVEPPVRTLWVLGPDPDDPRVVAVVGTRRPTPYGRHVARSLARDLALAGVTVVSGLAIGIDSEAHAGTLDAGGRTIAVVAGGVDVPMPPRNRGLYEKILATGGSILSEQPLGTPSLKNRYLERNRIIAGLADAVVVVQAGFRSGAGNTASWAGSFSREVLAVPGDIRAEQSIGVHALIREGAAICTSVRDVLEVAGYRPASSTRGEEGEPPGRDLTAGSLQDRLLAILAAGPARLEDLSSALGADPASCLRMLAGLQLSGTVAREGLRYSIPEVRRGP